MENNIGSGPKSYSQSRVLLVDPNPDQTIIKTPEDFSINVELRTYKKSRTAIELKKSGENDNVYISTGSSKKPISFINGSKINQDGDRSLTTHYTEIGSNFNKEETDLETLGIKDIQIEFNSSLAPMITINFTDVRGKLFELGANSPYSVFFELPFPIFELTVKGFYGNPVTYKLHLWKFNGSFNSSSGTFDVKCQFIGYTYAFLSDILIGYLKAIPYTKKGERMVKSLNEGTKDTTFLTFDELEVGISTLQSRLQQLKKDDPTIKGIALSSNVSDRLNIFEGQLVNSFVSLASGTSGDKLVSEFSDGIYISKGPLTTNDLTIYNQFIKTAFDGTDGLNSDNVLGSNYKLNNELFLVKDNITLFRKVRKTDFLTNDGIKKSFLVYKDLNNGFEIKKAQTDEKFYDYISNIVIGLTNIANETEIIIYDFRLVLNNIHDVSNKIKIDSKGKLEELGNTFVEKIRESFPDDDFNSSIGDFFKILCNHVDIFMDVIREVAVEAENPNNSPKRSDQLKGLIASIDDKFITFNGGENNDGKSSENIGSVKAFPDYRVLDVATNSLEDRWIGRLAPTMPEVIFVEDLLNAIIKAKQGIKKVEDNLTETNVFNQWYPINPFDIGFYNKKNPYEVIGNEGKDYDVMRLMAERYFILEAYSNKSLTDNERKAMAKLEANNAFKSIKNKTIKASLNNFGEANSDLGTSRVINILTGNIRVDGLNNFSSSWLMRESQTYPDSYLYEYVKNTRDTIDVTYLPLNSVNNDKTDFNGDFIVTKNGNSITQADQIALRDSGYVYFSNYKEYINRNITGQLDNGSTFIDFIDPEVFSSQNYKLDDYGTKILSESNLSTQISLDYDRVNTNIFNGNSGANEIFSIDIPNYGKVATPLLFYVDTDVPFLVSKKANFDTIYDKKIINNSITKLKNTLQSVDSTNIKNKFYDDRNYSGNIKKILSSSEIDDSYIPHIGFMSNNSNYFLTFFSLFGSDFYYQQNDMGKAFLLLNCLPFNTQREDSRTGALLVPKDILALFNDKAGFVDIPYSWILLIGGYLTRMDSTSDFLKFKEGNNYSLIPNVEYDDDIPSKDNLIGPRNFTTALEFGGNLVIGEKFGMLDNLTNDTQSGGNAEKGEYPLLDDVIRKLPPQARNKFKDEFKNWVIGDEFRELRNNLEIYKTTDTLSVRNNIWYEFGKLFSVGNYTAAYALLKSNVKNDYNVVSIDVDNRQIYNIPNNASTATAVSIIKSEHKDYGSPFNFFLELSPNAKGSKLLVDFISKTKILVNSTWTIWNTSDNIDNDYLNVGKTNLRNYIKTFSDEFSRLHEESIKINNVEVNEIKQELFNTIDADDIKLNIYKKIKMIYDKWICGTQTRYESVTEGNLFDTFKFIDRSYNNISNKFLLNPVVTIKHLFSSFNQSFYTYIGKILNDNNMDFHALPTYINYTNVDELNNVFRNFSYNDSINSNNISPAFICMYVGERSSNLDLGDKRNDGVNIELDSSGNILKTAMDMTNVNNADGVAEENKIPIFMVNYGDDNQSIFSNISLDQAEFTATDESLLITDELTNSRGIGQNLFDLYNSRSYTANIDMLGNPMIQPMMYFQLNHIPMFNGLYTIFKVSHSIKSNSMTTTFSGTRIREVKTKMVDASTIFINLIGSLSDVSIENASLDNIASAGGSKSGSKIDALSKYIIHKVGTQVGIKPKVGADDYALYQVSTFLIELGKKWSEFIKTKGSNYPRSIIYTDISKRLGEHDPDHGTHDNGLAVDIRLFTTTPEQYEAGGSDINQATYSREITRDFFDVLYKLNGGLKKNKGTWDGDRSPVELIYFNDPVIINEFSGKVINKRVIKIGPQKSHDDHIHIKFNVPDNFKDVLNDSKYFIEQPLPKENPNSKDLSEVLTGLGYQKNTVEHQYAIAIAKKEGYFNSNKNVAPIRNNNPGNLTGVSEYKSIDPKVTIDPKNKRFAKFSDIDKGTKALVQGKIITWANGKYPATIVNGNSQESKIYQEQNNIPQSVRNIAGKNVELTFEQFTYIYAPPSENQTEKYLNNIISDLNSQGFNVTRNSKIKDFLT